MQSIIVFRQQCMEHFVLFRGEKLRLVRIVLNEKLANSCDDHGNNPLNDENPESAMVSCDSGFVADTVRQDTAKCARKRRRGREQSNRRTRAPYHIEDRIWRPGRRQPHLHLE